jgi:hypothetical protein
MLQLPLCGSGDHASAKLPRTLQQIRNYLSGAKSDFFCFFFFFFFSLNFKDFD